MFSRIAKNVQIGITALERVGRVCNVLQDLWLRPVEISSKSVLSAAIKLIDNRTYVSITSKTWNTQNYWFSKFPILRI